MTHPTDALRLVPEASTGEMQAAGRDALEPFVGILKQPVEDQWHLARLVWSAMLAAAPASPLPLTAASAPIPPSTGVGDNGASPLPEGGGEVPRLVPVDMQIESILHDLIQEVVAAQRGARAKGRARQCCARGAAKNALLNLIPAAPTGAE